MLILHSFWLSLATYRVRIALRLKGVEFEERTHDLRQGDQNTAAFRAVNPAGAVPALEGATRTPLTQSLAILEWLEETYPEPALLPLDAEGRARVRALFLLTAADTHPIVVPRVQKQLAERFGADEAAGRDGEGAHDGVAHAAGQRRELGVFFGELLGALGQRADLVEQRAAAAGALGGDVGAREIEEIS